MKKLFIFILLILSITFAFGFCTKGYLEANTALKNYQQKVFVKHLQKSTIVIMRSQFLHTKWTAKCSGLWINKYDILTARHCIENDDDQAVLGELIRFKTFNDYKPETWKFDRNKENLHIGFVKAFTKGKDLAIISTTYELEHDIAYISNEEIFDGMNVHILGHPAGMEYAYIQGVVSKTRITDDFGQIQKTIHVTALTAGGSSGGGVYNDDGKIIGITSFSYDIPGMKFKIHRDEILLFLNNNQIIYYQ